MPTSVLIIIDSHTLGARLHELSQAAEIIGVFHKHGHNEIDTARIYGAGSSENMLAAIDYQKRGIVMDTELYPNADSAMATSDSHTHKPEDVRPGLINSLKALKNDKINMFYLHGPERKTPWEDTLREVNKLHKEGLFDLFGISNYMS
jgi:aflatoxin B1 aldehyde reductase